jgi:chemotaxis family two-component system response regulator Rcp1
MTIFIAEDNPADVYLLRIAFTEAGHQGADLVIASDGEAALELVQHRGSFQNAGRPDLIVLDLNLPKSDGSDVLRAIRQSDEYTDVPVVVLTSSDSPRDRQYAEELGADCYLTKPSDLEAFLGLGKRLVSLACRPGRTRVATH